jgi:hypothetical protein
MALNTTVIYFPEEKYAQEAGKIVMCTSVQHNDLNGGRRGFAQGF